MANSLSGGAQNFFVRDSFIMFFAFVACLPSRLTLILHRYHQTPFLYVFAKGQKI
jgi:hypothetical protein